MIAPSSPFTTVALIGCLSGVLAISGCAGLGTSEPSGPTQSNVASPKPVEVTTYLEIFDQMAPGDVGRQTATLAALRAIAQQNPTATNRLKYALALGAAGRADSNPVEAKRLIADLLAEQNDLQPKEVSLGNAYLREFDARVTLYADLARQREEAERKLQAVDADGNRRAAALNGENQKLKKALADAESKLEAVAEMEKSLAPPEGQPPRQP
jgi:hypothetical protein